MKKSLYLLILTVFTGFLNAELSKAQSYFSGVTYNSGVGLYEKFEINFNISASFVNPYDEDEIRIYCQFTDPSDNHYYQDAFYYKGAYATYPSSDQEKIELDGTSTWKVRFAPNSTGQWKFRLTALDNNGNHLTSYYTFQCVSADNKGFIRIKDDRYLKYDDNSTYIPVGSSYPWYKGARYNTNTRGTLEIKDAMDEMKTNGINFFRFDINFVDALSIIGYDFQHNENYYSFFNQRDSWRLDKIIEYAEQKDINLLLALFSHAAFGETGYCNNAWSRYNPFYINVLNKPPQHDIHGDCNTPYEFYSKASARKIQRSLIRYIIARWGYSTNIMAYELMDEADRFHAYYPTVPPPNYNQTIIDWHVDIKNYINSNDPFNHLVTTGFSGQSHPATDLYQSMEFSQVHKYIKAEEWNASVPFQKNLYDDISDYLSRFSKPAFHGEFGWSHDTSRYVEDPKLYDLHPHLWAGLFSGALSPPTFWDLKNYVIPYGQTGQYKGVSTFSRLLTDLDDNYVPYREQKHGFRLYYLKNAQSKTLYGWIQDYNFRLPYIYNNYNRYLNNWSTDRPPYASASYLYSVNISVPEDCKYILKWYDTQLGMQFGSDRIVTTRSKEVQLNLTHLLSGTWADRAFILTCKPGTGWVEKQTAPKQWNNVRSDSEIEMNSFGTHIFYINSSKKVCELYKKGTAWQDAVLNSSRLALSGRGLVFNPLDGDIYYVGSDAKIDKLYYSSGQWLHTNVSSGQWNNVRSDSELEINTSGSHIFYINTGKKVCALYKNGSTWEDAVLNSSAKTAVSGRGLVYNPLDNSVLYTGSDYKIYKLYYSSGSWYYTKVSSNQWNNVKSNSELKVSVSGRSIYYVNSYGDLCLLYKNGSSWSDGVILSSAEEVKDGTNFIVDKSSDKIYYIGEDNYIHSIYYSGEWKHVTIHQTDYCQEKALSGIYSVDDHIYFTGTDYKIHDFANSSALKSSEQAEIFLPDENDNDITVYPNPVKTDGTLYFDLPFDMENSGIRIYNNSGILVREMNLTNNSIEVDHLPEGLYMIHITNGENMMIEKIMIVK